jgi:RHS repeat-associated protein
MGVVNYSYGNGQLVSETRSGVHSAYCFDALGNTTKLIDTTSLSVTDKFEYQAYGEVFNRVGSTPTPYQYVGAYGYFSDSSGLDYLRARYFDPNLGAFLSKDAISPSIGTFLYGAGVPTSMIDPSGRDPIITPGCPGEVAAIVAALCQKLGNLTNDDRLKINHCLVAIGGGACRHFDRGVLDCMLSFCAGFGIVTCGGPDCGPNTCAHTCLPSGFFPLRIIELCYPNLSQHGCSDIHGDPNLNNVSETLLHEMGHCCGVAHGNHPVGYQCNDLMACCILEVMHGEGDPANKCARHP